MIYSKLAFNKKYAVLRAVLTLLLTARIILNFQIYDQAHNYASSRNSVNASIEASKSFIQFDGAQNKKDNQNKPIQGSFYLVICDEASVKPARLLFSIFRSSILSLINYSAFLSSHFSTDT